MAPDSIPARSSVVIPAFNEAASTEGVVRALRQTAAWREILVGDDGSSDDTGATARNAGACVIRQPSRKENGAAVNSALRQAAGEYILILDADGQHSPHDALRLVSHLDAYDLTVGARSPQTQATMARRSGNAALNALASYLVGRNTVRFESIAAARPEGASKITLGADGVRFFLILLKVITIFSPLRVFLPVSAVSFVAGAAYAAWTIATQSHVTNSSVLLILASVLIFLIGLVSEQISSLRFEGRRP